VALRPSLLRRARGVGIAHARRTRAALPALAATAAVAVAVAVVTQIWGSALQPPEGTALREAQVAADVVAAPGARTFDAAGMGAKLVVTPGRAAALAVGRLPRAPTGGNYEAWVTQPGRPAAPRPAATFTRTPALVALRGRVPSGATVTVTAEPVAGRHAPRGRVVFVVQTA
jgi:hypothetical protein